MITANKVTKTFDGFTAVDSVSAEMKSGSVFGLIGSNGAGKSTFLRMVAGVLKPDSGEICIDGQGIWESREVKQKCFFIPDDLFFFKNSMPKNVCEYYSLIYPTFSKDRFYQLLSAFNLPTDKRIATFSKGMRRQTMIITALASGCEYLLCDETFDGLDPVARQAVKSIFAAEIGDRGLTQIIASHNLRELEDICDHVGLLHNGGILFSQDLDEIKLGVCKLQCAFAESKDRSFFYEDEGFKILKFERRGALLTMTVKGERNAVSERIRALNPLFCEVLPLSLEEIFISETEVCGYDIKKLLF